MKRNYRVHFETKFGNESYQIITQSSIDNNFQTNIKLKKSPSITSIFSLFEIVK